MRMIELVSCLRSKTAYVQHDRQYKSMRVSLATLDSQKRRFLLHQAQEKQLRSHSYLHGLVQLGSRTD
jgi:hypothetical protein